MISPQSLPGALKPADLSSWPRLSSLSFLCLYLRLPLSHMVLITRHSLVIYGLGLLGCKLLLRGRDSVPFFLLTSTPYSKCLE